MKKSASYKNLTPIPKPPKATKRNKKLPSETLKSMKDDPKALKRVETILKSPSYLPADRDADFLRDDSVRGVRLQIDYLKTELLLQEYGVEQTIAIFGGTRIVEEEKAEHNLSKIKDKYSKNPENKLLRKKLKVSKNILEKSHYYDIARDFGRIVGNSGKGPSDCSVTVMTGGGPGIMEAANRGAFDVGAKSIGLNITLPKEQFPNPYISPELCFKFHYFSMRKLHFFKRAKALVAFPGGFGTIDELMEALTLIQTRKIAPMPVILVGEDFWKKAINFDYLLDEGVIDAEDMELFWYAQTAEDIWESIIHWHTQNGKPLIL